MGVTGRHRIPSANKGYAAARTFAAGDRVVADTGEKVAAGGNVARVWEAEGPVRYLVTQGRGDILVGGVAASQHSTPFGWLESAPFRFLDWLWPGLLEWAPVDASLRAALDSPMLEAFEVMTDWLTGEDKQGMHAREGYLAREDVVGRRLQYTLSLLGRAAMPTGCE